MTVIQFLSKPKTFQDELLPLLHLVKPLPCYKKRTWLKQRTHGVKETLRELSFGEINTLKNLLTSQNPHDVIKAVEMVYNEKNALKMPLVRFYRCVRFITEEIQNIIRTEAKCFVKEPSPLQNKLENAGLSQLQRFGDLPVIDTLAGGDIFKYEAIEKLPYMTVFYVLWYRTVTENINTRLANLSIR